MSTGKNNFKNDTYKSEIGGAARREIDKYYDKQFILLFISSTGHTIIVTQIQWIMRNKPIRECKPYVKIVKNRIINLNLSLKPCVLKSCITSKAPTASINNL